MPRMDGLFGISFHTWMALIGVDRHSWMAWLDLYCWLRELRGCVSALSMCVWYKL